ncbi:lysophospholipid acyltransferase family protein [Niabella terrae]
MYYVIYYTLYLFSLLPLRVLYFISDSLYGMLYHVFQYRRKVVMGNLKIAFPEKTDAELITIEKGFYHNFIDSMIETVKLLSATDDFFEKHFTGNFELLEHYYRQGRSVQLHLGHNFNWEWGTMMVAHQSSYQFLGVYMPLSNKAIEKLFRKIRSRSGTRLINATRMSREFLPYRRSLYCLGLIADQSPGLMHKAHWFDFFNRKTAFTIGPAKSAIANDAVIIFVYLNKIKRGYYQAHFSVNTETPRAFKEDELTDQFVQFLENNIRQYPQMWLWSHRRWKHSWQNGDPYFESPAVIDRQS